MKNDFLTLFNNCDQKLKSLAFTHSSYANEHKIESNERVEFLGDSVLSVIVSDFLYKNYHKSEGRMSKIRANFVCTENLSRVARELGIEKNIKYGHSFKGKEVSSAMLADTIESMIGVMYLTYGLDAISSAVLEVLKVKETLKAGVKINDFKSELQEYAQQNKRKLNYKIEKLSAETGEEFFRASCFLDGEFVSFGQGSTKREAEQNSAHLALKKVKNPSQGE